jgi:hypothetical protein
MGTLKFLFGVLIFSTGACRSSSPSASERPFPNLLISTIEASPDGVTLSWIVDPVDPRASLFYRIERRKKGGTWHTVADDVRSRGEITTYLDLTIEPKTDYEYRVRLGSTPNGLTDKMAGPVSIRSPGLWRFEFSNMLSDPDAERGQAYVTIRKYDKEHGFVEWRKIQREGDLLGVVKEEGGERTNHRVATKDGKTVFADFKSGARLLKVTTNKLVLYTYMVCRANLNRKGKPECRGPEEVKDHVRVNEAKFTDEDGREQVFQAPAGPEQRMPDVLCPLHRTRPATELEERIRRREAECLALLDEADELWLSDDVLKRRKAKAIYGKLLTNYLDLMPVRARRAELNDRALMVK